MYLCLMHFWHWYVELIMALSSCYYMYMLYFFQGICPVISSGFNS